MARPKPRTILIMLVFVVTAAYFLLFVVIQQTMRLTTNEPQVSMARNISSQLQSGKPAASIPQGYIDMSTDTSPFIIIYDQFGQVISGNGYLDNTVPRVPIGVLGAAKGSKIHTVTWQPQDNVRVASASAQAGNNYVLVGRSLAVIEKKLEKVAVLVLVAWLVTIVLLIAFFRLVFKKKPANSAQTPKKP